jgi:PAS domain-containing protein
MQLKFDWLIVLENLRRGIMVTDSTLQYPRGPRMIYVNRAWMKMTGYDREDIRGKTPRTIEKFTSHSMQNDTSSSQCQCSTGPKLIFLCSGASDVGEISDRVA